MRPSGFKTRFCSRDCMYEAFRGGGNPNYKHGQNKAAARETAKRLLPRACVVCGWDTHVQTHHIKPRREGGTNEVGNLVMLCPNHHWMADHGLLTPAQLSVLAPAPLELAGLGLGSGGTP